jgi:type II secretory pathway pseudopilin PulG
MQSTYGAPSLRRLGRASSGGARHRRAAFTVLEVLIAASAMLVAALGFSQALIATMRASRLTREQAVATEAARQRIEQIRSVNFRDAFRQYNAHPDDDLNGIGTAPGGNFAVAGLDPAAGDNDGFAGEIVFPVNANAPGVLREDMVMPDLGCPFSLDGDVNVDTADHSLDYQILPVLVRVRWRGPNGDAVVQLQTYLGDAL